MNLERKPFERVHLEGEEPTKQDKVQVKLNSKQRATLEELKLLLNVPFDSTVFKLALECYKNVLLDTLGEEQVKYLCSMKRKKLY
jgi:hypothetical protein